MKITIEDVTYKGVHFDRCEFDLANLTAIEEIPMDKLEEYIIDSLERCMDMKGEEA